MDDLISRQSAIEVLEERLQINGYSNIALISELNRSIGYLMQLPAAEPTLKEQALMLLLNWAVECGFGYDNFPEEYERYKSEIENMSYLDGMIYIAEKEVERYG